MGKRPRKTNLFLSLVAISYPSRLQYKAMQALRAKASRLRAKESRLRVKAIRLQAAAAFAFAFTTQRNPLS